MPDPLGINLDLTPSPGHQNFGYDWFTLWALKGHNVFLKVTFHPWLHRVKICLHTIVDNGENMKVSNSLCGPCKPLSTLHN